ncbi:MAG: hypothetical protein E7405_04455 [Ruminococcaceae bacterium]|nr:hypothetical protein [Oscillospiraceae bacterium]
MKKKSFITSTIIAGIAAVAGAVVYKVAKDQMTFSCDRWDIDIAKRYRMADNLIRSEALIGKEKDEVLSILGINGLKSNTDDSMEYYLNQDTENPKLLIIQFGEDGKVTSATACV